MFNTFVCELLYVWLIDSFLEQSGVAGLDHIVNDVPEGFEAASQLIQNLINELSQTYNVPVNKIIVGGFSQVCIGGRL